MRTKTPETGLLAQALRKQAAQQAARGDERWQKLLHGELGDLRLGRSAVEQSHLQKSVPKILRQNYEGRWALLNAALLVAATDGRVPQAIKRPRSPFHTTEY